VTMSWREWITLSAPESNQKRIGDESGRGAQRRD